jgi:mycothiol synthase
MDRCYTGWSDQQQMLELVHRQPEEHLHVMDLPYRLCSWALDEPENVHLWFSGGRLCGWAALQSPFWFIDYAVDPPADSDLHAEVLEWALQRARSMSKTSPYWRPAWFIPAFSFQVEKMAVLQASGFRDQSRVPVDPWSKVLLSRPAGTALQTGPLPPGYCLRPLKGPVEIPALVELHQTVFQSKNMTLAWRTRIQEHPSFHPELNLVIEAPGGKLAAFCTAWFDPAGYGGRPAGQIEPLGVTEAERGKGLSNILLAEAFHLLGGLGAEQIFVETDLSREQALAAYLASGYSLLHRVHIWRADL